MTTLKKIISFVALMSIIFVYSPSMNAYAQCVEHRIVYTGYEQLDGDSNIFIANTCTGEHEQITIDGMSRMPVASPDGSKIAFQRQIFDDTGDHIYVMSLDGTEAINVTNPLISGYNAAWSPTGEYISFVGQDAETIGFQLYRVNADGSDLQQLTDLPGNVSYATWSLDGRFIAFVHMDEIGAQSIYVANIDGSQALQIPIEGVFDREISWSPDSSSILYSALGNFYLLEPMLLTTTQLATEMGDLAPSWSPDGTQIAFVRVVHVFTMDAAGENQTQLTTEGFSRRAVWSPDGTQIAFLSYQGDDPSDSDLTQIYIMNADGSEQTKLTQSDTSVRQEHPSWIPERDSD